MLQQTQASRVAPAYRAFLERFPTIRALARAPRPEVIRAWSGLGYNRRAVTLSEAARSLVRDHDGRIPRKPATLERLPGIGPYTAAAVASLAFGVPVAAVDTNVRRVIARVHLGLEPHEAAASEIATFAHAWLDRRDPGAWNSALMDLGREVCRPRPRCEACPLARGCHFRAAGATGGRGPARQGRFEGSTRQVRGAVVRVLRARGTISLGRLSDEIGLPEDRITPALAGLMADGLVAGGPAARQGRPSGRVRLAG